VASRLQGRIRRIDQQVRSQADVTSNLVPITIPWSDEDGGPKTYRDAKRLLC
jgi:hypothetical protein